VQRVAAPEGFMSPRNPPAATPASRREARRQKNRQRFEELGRLLSEHAESEVRRFRRASHARLTRGAR
jgi:hypothetical protein